jgi:hypothetical protein
MESISREVKYFVTPNNNIVRGAIDGGKLVDAEFFVSNSNEYNTPSQLNNLMKERMCLSQGKVNLKQIDRINYSNYNIPVDAGSIEVGGGKKDSKTKTTKTTKPTKPTNKSMAAGSLPTQEVPCIEKPNEVIIPEVVVAGVPLNRSLSNKSVSKQSNKPMSKQSNKPMSKQSQSKVMSAGAAPDKKMDTVSLADIFKKVSLQLAKQAEGIILEGGNPVELIKDDIVFFN